MILAMAGLGEAAMDVALVVMGLGLVIIATAGFAAWRFRSQAAFYTMCVCWLLFTLLFAPWAGFLPLDEQAKQDADAVRFAGDFYKLAVAWALVTVFGALSAVGVFSSQAPNVMEDQVFNDEF